MKTVLVTGCAGFIGWKVSEKLLEKNIGVAGIDNMNDYYDTKLKIWRLDQLKRNKQFIFHQGDIGSFQEVKTVFANHQLDAVINLAARAGVRASVEDPWAYLDTNTKGTLNLL